MPNFEATQIEASLSTTSTISASEQDSSIKEQEHKTHELLLDLKLSNKDSESGSNPKLISSKLSSSSIDVCPNKEPNDRVFCCHYCPRKFSSSQALGGHQNAHKRERTMAKRRQEMDNMGYGSYPNTHLYPYTGLGTFPTLHGSLNRSLGIRMQSTAIRKPYYSWALPGLRYYHSSWAKPDSNPQLAGTMGRVNNGGFKYPTMNSKNAVTNSIGGTHRWRGSPLEIQEKEIQPQELDLSLKL